MNPKEATHATEPALDMKTGYVSLITAVLGTSLASLFYKLSFATGLHPL